MRAIELSEQATLRLHEITEYYLANESKERTLKVLDSFDKAFYHIANRPFGHRRFYSNEFINLDIRIYLHFKIFHIYYVASADTVRIAEIFHLHQDGNKLKLDI